MEAEVYCKTPETSDTYCTLFTGDIFKRASKGVYFFQCQLWQKKNFEHKRISGSRLIPTWNLKLVAADLHVPIVPYGKEV